MGSLPLWWRALLHFKETLVNNYDPRPTNNDDFTTEQVEILDDIQMMNEDTITPSGD